ncbi:MAG: SRPBCC domain-containing protein [Bacteroidia bacterium]
MKGMTVFMVLTLLTGRLVAQAAPVCDRHGVRTEVAIHAPADSVWKVLTDVAAYPDWHPYMRTIEGKWKRGKMLHFTMVPTDKGERKFSAKLLVMDAPREWAWGGAFLFFLKARHSFVLTPNVDGGTLMVQEERWGGMFGGSYGKKYFEEACRNFEAMNRALAERVASPK